MVSVSDAQRQRGNGTNFESINGEIHVGSADS